MIPQAQPAEVLPRGMNVDRASKGPVLQNVWPMLGGVEVRPGFGQVARMTTGQRTDGSVAIGYERLLGTHSITTSFGHDQVLSLWTLRGVTSNTLLANVSVTPRYALCIYDVETRRYAEVVLHRQTSERGEDVTPMPYWLPAYSSNKSRDVQGWIAASSVPQPFFASLQGAVIFGSTEIGLWVYDPVDVARGTDSAIDGVLFHDCHRPDGECSFVVRVFPVPGAFSDGFSYMGVDQFPSPVDACAVGSQLVTARGRSVYLSDPGAPASIRSNNVIDLPTRGEIVAVGQAFGTIVAMTGDETWAIRIPPNGLLDYADVRQLSSSDGCLGPQARVNAEGALIWCDHNGIYSFDGGTEIQNIGEELKPLFYDGLSLPLSSYYPDDGKTSVANRQPSSFIRWGDAETVAAYDPTQRALFVCLPNSSAALCRKDGGWSVWTFESTAASVDTVVSSTNNMPFLRVSTTTNGVYGVCGPVSGANGMEDAVVVQLGVGGAIDRSADATADHRLSTGGYQKLLSAAAGAPDGRIIIGRPHPVDAGEKAGVNTLASAAKLVPVWLIPPEGVFLVDQLELVVTLANGVEFSPVLSGGLPTEQIDVIFPAERDKARDGWGFGAALNTGIAEVQAYDAPGGVPTIGGQTMVARFDGNNANIAEVWSWIPSMVVSPHGKQPLFWLLINNPTLDQADMWLSATTAHLFDHATVQHHLEVWAYNDGAAIDRDTTARVAQPVDWVIASDYVSDDASQSYLRGVRSAVISHGENADIVPNSRFGLMNAVFRADWRDWGAQIQDFVLGNQTQGKTTVRARMLVTGALQRKLFGDPTTGVLKWGESGTDKGNTLIDDEPLDTMDISQSVKGEGVGVMLFGHVRGVAERINLSSLKLFLRPGGTPRRTGR